MNKETLNKLKELTAAKNDFASGEPAYRMWAELLLACGDELIALAERTTSPVSQMTDERIIEIKHEVSKRYNSAWHLSDSAACEFARAILAAAAPQAQDNDAQDAARYRFLKNVDPDAEDPVVMLHVQNDWGNWAYMHLGGDDLDEAINAAMSAESANCQDNEGEKA